MLIGAHLDNLDQPSEASYARLRAMRARVVGTLWIPGARHKRPVYDRLDQELDRPRYIVRVGPSSHISATDWRAEATDALWQTPEAVRQEGRIAVRVLNEVTLPSEGEWSAREYADLLAQIRVAGPINNWTYPLVCAPVSLGWPEWREWWRAFVTAGGLAHVDRVAVNCYAHLVAEAIAFFRDVGRPVDVTELNTLQLPPGTDRGRWIADRAHELANVGFSTAQVFVVGGRSFGAWDERYILADDEAAEIGRLTHGEIAPTRRPTDVSDDLPTPDRRPTPVNGRETPGNGRSEPVPARTNPWAGAVGIVWNLPPDPRTLVDLGHLLGLSAWDLKVANGGVEWHRVGRDVIDRLRGEGFAVTGWTYPYCDLAGFRFHANDGVPEHEADALADAAERLGLDGVTLDLEGEPEGHADLVEIALRRLDERLPEMPLAVYTWASRVGHESYPWSTIRAALARRNARGVPVAWRPMVYRAVQGATGRWSWNSEDCWQSLGSTFTGLPVAPAYSVMSHDEPVGVTIPLPMIREDVAQARRMGTIGASFWELSGLAARRAEIAALLASTRVVPAKDRPTPVPVDPAVAAGETLAQLFRASEALFALGDPASIRSGHAVQAAIDAHKYASRR